MATVTIENPTAEIIEVQKPEAIITVPDFESSYFIPATTFTAKGDILVGTGNGTYTKVSAGADGTIPVASSAQPGGIVFQSVAGLTGVTLQLPLFLVDETWDVGDGINYLPIPVALNGKNLTGVIVDIIDASTSGLPTIQIHNLTDNVDMLSTKCSVDENEKSSRTASTPLVIDTAHDDVATGDMLRIDVDIAGNAKGGIVTLEFS